MKRHPEAHRLHWPLLLSLGVHVLLAVALLWAPRTPPRTLHAGVVQLELWADGSEVDTVVAPTHHEAPSDFNPTQLAQNLADQLDQAWAQAVAEDNRIAEAERRIEAERLAMEQAQQAAEEAERLHQEQQLAETIARLAEEARIAEEIAEAERQAELARQAEEAQRLAEAEARRLAEEQARQAEEARRLAEAEARRQAEEQARQAEEARRLAEAEARRLAEEQARQAEEARRLAEAEARRLAEEQARQAEEARRLAEAEARRQAEEQARQAEEAQRLAEAEARRLAEEQARQTEEAQRLAEAAQAKRRAEQLKAAMRSDIQKRAGIAGGRHTTRQQGGHPGDQDAYAQAVKACVEPRLRFNGSQRLRIRYRVDFELQQHQAHIVVGSGNTAFDLAALAALRQCRPFPKPPNGESYLTGDYEYHPRPYALP